MKILKIKSHSMHEALAEARRQLGDNVTVLHTKQCEEPVMMGFGRRQSVEILAAAETPVIPAQPNVKPLSVNAPAGSGLETVTQQITDIKHILTRLENEHASAPAQSEPSPIFERLVRNGVTDTLAELLVTECKSAKDSNVILNSIARRINVSGPITCGSRQARVVLVGPTGVGKTTTAAKLAALYSLVHKKNVAMITLDTYRVAAVEQLGTYSRILNIPFEVALCPEDVDLLISKHRDKDLIIIDTVGRSQRNMEHLAELARFVRAAAPTEVHLVVSASSSQAVQKESVESFSALAANRLILTKLDECPQAGCILSLSTNSLLPFSYITYGQEVPDDIAQAEKDRLAKLVWEGAL
ncbi:MAG: AAA family ATPase [Armatimonadota bacterium]